MKFPGVDYALLGPEIIVTVLALLLLVMDFVFKASKRPLWCMTLIGLGAAILWTSVHFYDKGTTLAGMFVGDPFANFFKLVLLSTAFLVVLIAPDSRRMAKSSGSMTNGISVQPAIKTSAPR